MREEDIRSMVSSGFKAGREDADSWSYEIEIFLLTLKSLVPSLEYGGNRLDYTRFRKELELWKSYRHGGDTAMMDILKDSYENYCINRDSTLFYRVLAISFANESIEVIKEELLKNITYFTGDSEQILEGIYLGSFLGCMFNGDESVELEALAKDCIVKFSLKEELLDRRYLKLDLSEGYGKYVVGFERNRIKLLDKLSGKPTDGFKVVDMLMDIVENSTKTGDSKAKAFLESFRNGCDTENRYSLADGIAKYLWKLRKGWISSEQIKIDRYIEPDIFRMKVGESGFHSLLNRIKLISAEERDGFEIRYIETKTGVYRFFKRKNGR